MPLGVVLRYTFSSSSIRGECSDVVECSACLTCVGVLVTQEATVDPQRLRELELCLLERVRREVERAKVVPETK